jgi:hypothetical protein
MIALAARRQPRGSRLSGDFDRMRDDYNTMYKPVTLEEQNLVAEMFATGRRIRRATTIETALIDCERVTEEPKVKAKFAISPPPCSLADESKSLALVCILATSIWRTVALLR